MKRNVRSSLARCRAVVLAVVAMFAMGVPAALAAPTPASTTTLTVASSSVPSGTALVFTATVSAGGAPVTRGSVSFCYASAAHCQGGAVLGSAQLNASGTATLKKVIAIGTHPIVALFRGTNAAATSMSAQSTVTVTGSLSTGLQLTQTGQAGNYTLNANVLYYGQATLKPDESITFNDSTNNNATLGTATLGAATASFTYTSANAFSAGNAPMDIASGDFDWDGIPDLAVANFRANTVTVYKGAGDGTFTPLGAAINVGNHPVAVKTGDFNSDGLIDLAVLNQTDATISILLNNGAGGFTSMGTVSTQGSGPSSLAVLDMDRDGNPDLVVTNLYSSTLAVLLGDGAGNFSVQAGSPFATGGNPTGVVLADLDGDSVPDLAFANTYDGTVSILHNAGGGSYTPVAGSPFAVTAAPSGIAVGDFNNDGLRDLAVIDGSKNQMTVLLNALTGFTVSAPMATGQSPAAVATGDDNGDGDVDILITNANDGTATRLQGDGTGKFPTSTSFTLGGGAQGLVFADLNGDGLLDYAATTLGLSQVVDQTELAYQTAAGSLANVAVYGGGTHNVVANYGGDGVFLPGSSNAVALTGTLVPTTSTLFVSPATTVAYGATVQLSDTVAPSTQSGYSATGTVSFTSDGAALNSATLVNGQGAISVTNLQVGTHSVATAYSGDVNFATSSSAAQTVTVTKANTTTSVAVNPTTLTVGQSVTLSATVSSATTGTPTGQVTFYDGATVLNTATLVNGRASASTAALGAGTHAITAQYGGDGNYNTSTSAANASPVTVLKVQTTLTLGSSAASVLVGMPVTLTATISAPSTGETGMVTFYDGTATLGQAAVAGGAATYTTTALTAGTHSLTAVYSGDATFTTSTSGAVAQSVLDFTISAGTGGSATQSVLPGNTATFALTLASSGGAFPLPLTLSASGLPPGATYTLTPATVPAGATQTAVTLAVKVPSQTGSVAPALKRLGSGLTLALLVLPFAGRVRRRGRALRGAVLLVLAGAGSLLVLGLSGCASTTGVFGQAPQSYTVTVTATAGAVSHSTNVTLVVQ